MSVLLVVLILLAVALLLWFLPVRVQIAFRQHALEVLLGVWIKVPLFSFGREINISEKVAMAIEHMAKRWQAKGEPVKPPLQVTVRRVPRSKIMRAVLRPVRYLGRRTRCSLLGLNAEVGGYDAMESALLAGLFWSVSGWLLSAVSRMVHLESGAPEIQITPNFRAPVLHVEANCILEMRLGHAIVAGIWLLRRAVREREIVAWVRDSLRRKGVEGDGRTSDSGAHEDGHGEPERHG